MSDMKDRGWISVKEELPIPYQIVDILVRSRTVYPNGVMNDERKWMRDDPRGLSLLNEPATHWRPAQALQGPRASIDPDALRAKVRERIAEYRQRIVGLPQYEFGFRTNLDMKINELEIVLTMIDTLTKDTPCPPTNTE